jgi:uncharacterized membrane protein YgcG
VAAVALAMAAPAWATPTATVTPLGPGALFVTLTNPGPETITGYITTPPEQNYAINIATGQVCQFEPYIIAPFVACRVTLAPATSAQICFAGSAPELYPQLGMLIWPAGGLPYRITVSTSSVAPACPFSPSGAGSGSTSGASGTPGSGGGGGSGATPVTPNAVTPKHVTPSKGAHSWSRARCKSAYKAWTKKHRRATRRQKKAEASTLHKAHGCPLSILK